MAACLLGGGGRWGGLFLPFAAGAFRKLPSIYVFGYFTFGFEGRCGIRLYQFLIIAYLFTLDIN